MLWALNFPYVHRRDFVPGVSYVHRRDLVLGALNFSYVHRRDLVPGALKFPYVHRRDLVPWGIKFSLGLKFSTGGNLVHSNSKQFIMLYNRKNG